MKSTEQIIDSILDRGIIVDILPNREEFKKILLSGKQLRFFWGADPTGKALHLSHAKNLMLLEEFRQLGHSVTVLFGDFTACIGDPSDRSSSRSRNSREEARRNAETWVKQISAIINFTDKVNPAQIAFNSSWLDKFSVAEVMEIFSNLTLQQLIERDMFQKRLSENKPIFLNEFLYPVFQGWDSVALNADVELCGTDQVFNALVGRSFLKKFANKEKIIIVNHLMENPKTGELMSKSARNGVFLDGDAQSMFGEIMALPDEMIRVVLINNTRIPFEEIDKLDIENKAMDAKLFTAREVTKLFWGEESAQFAHDNFIKTFSKKTFPTDAPTLKITEKIISSIDLIALCMPHNSRSQCRRLLEGGAVKINDEKLTKDEVEIKGREQVQIGKRGFFTVETQ